MCHLKIDDFEFPRNTNAAAMPKTPNRAHTLDNHPPQPSHFHSHSSLALANMGMGVIDPVHPFPRSQKPPFSLSQYLDAILFYFPTTHTSNSTTHFNLLRTTICVRRRGSQFYRPVPQCTRTARGRDWRKKSHLPTSGISIACQLISRRGASRARV